MISIALPASLAPLVNEGAPLQRCVLNIDAHDWAQVVEVLQEQHPQLAARVLSPTGEIAKGVALAVNDTLIAQHQAIEVAKGDRVSFVPQISGGA